LQIFFTLIYILSSIQNNTVRKNLSYKQSKDLIFSTNSGFKTLKFYNPLKIEQSVKTKQKLSNFRSERESRKQNSKDHLLIIES
jgi:hypothetical protein